MFYITKKIITFFLLLTVLTFFITNNSFAHNDAKENKPENEYKYVEPVKLDSKKTEKKNKTTNNQKSVTWTESLSLQDFSLSPDLIEMMSKAKEYKKVLAKTYEENPAVFSTAISYGLLLIDLNEIEKAKLVWEKAVKDFHSNDTPKVYKAWLDARLGNYEEAKNTWFPIAKSKVDRGVVGLSSGIWLPYHIDAILGLYLIKDNLPENERQEVSDVVNSIIGAIPQNSRFAAALINDYLKSGQLEKAAGLLVTSLKSSPDDPTLITLLGIAQLMTNHPDEALKLFDKANEINPTILTNHIMRARALFTLNREQESFEELDIAMKLNPDLIISENKKKKYLTAKSYLISKKLKKESKTEESKS